MLKTKSELMAYIRARLGYPVVDVEIADVQLDFIIDEVIQKFSDFAMGGSSLSYFQITTVPNVFQYQLDDRVNALSDVKFRSNNFSYQMPGGLIVTPSDFYSGALLPNGKTDPTSVAAVLSQLSMLEKMFDYMPPWDFNDNTKILTFFEDTTKYGDNMIVEVSLSYEPKEIDAIYDHQWVKEMSYSKAKFQWGMNVGKYDGTLINGSRINYEAMKNEALADIERLNQELLSRWSRPLGIYRG